MAITVYLHCSSSHFCATGDSLGPYNSPALGVRTSLEIDVTTDVANGVVGFATMDDLEVFEPDGREKLKERVSTVIRETCHTHILRYLNS